MLNMLNILNMLAGVFDELKLRFNSSKTPAGSNLGEHYKIL